MSTFGDARWHHTGDIGNLDVDNYVFIMDRAKDTIITAGVNVLHSATEADVRTLMKARLGIVKGRKVVKKWPDHLVRKSEKCSRTRSSLYCTEAAQRPR
jgi:hypothetical protein